MKRIANERGISFREALNSLLRAGLSQPGPGARRYRLAARRLGLRPGIDLDKAAGLAATLEDEETIRKLELRK